MAGSILVPVRSKVIEGLEADIKAAVNTDDHEVEFAYMWKEDPSVREWVYTNKGQFNHTPASMRSGRNFRDEIGRFVVTVLVAGVDLTQQETSDRCMEIAAEVQTWIADRKNNDLNVPGLQTFTVDGDGFLDEMYGETGHLAIAEIPCKYTARLQ